MRHRRPHPSLVLAALWAVAVAASLLARPLLPVDETRYLAAAWEMWQRSDFLVPYLNGAPYSHKPPLLFWGMHLGWALFGVNDWWPRLVAPLFGLGTLLLTRRLAGLLWPGDREIGTAAALICLGALFWTLFSTLTFFDTLHALFTVIGILGLVTAAGGRAPRGFALFGLAIGLGVLAKGPAILLHLLPAALAAPLWVSSGPQRPDWPHWYLGIAAGVLVGAAIGLAWAVPAGLSGGKAYMDAIFWGQSAGRVVDSFAHGRPFWWYAAILPAMALPWTVWPAAWRALGGGVATLKGDGGIRLCVIWFVAAFVVFSLVSGKQPHYLLPEFPALALILARALAAALASGSWRRADAWVPAGFAAGLAALVAAAALLGLRPSWATSAGAPDLWPLALPVAAAALVLWRPGVTLAARAGAIAAVSVSLVVSLHLTLRPIMQRSHDLAPFAQTLKGFENRGYAFAILGDYHGQFQFLGRLTHRFTVFDGPRSLRLWLADHPKAVVVDLVGEPPASPAPDAAIRFRGRWFVAWDAARYPFPGR